MWQIKTKEVLVTQSINYIIRGSLRRVVTSNWTFRMLLGSDFYHVYICSNKVVKNINCAKHKNTNR